MTFSTNKSVFNSKYEMLYQVESKDKYKIYLCRSLKNKNKEVKIKIFRKNYISNDSDAILKFERELTIH